MEFNQALNILKSRPLTDFVSLTLTKSGNGYQQYCCPICGSGTKNKKTGALTLYSSNRVICYAGNCFGEKGEDTPGALSRIWGCSLPEVLQRTGYLIESNGNETRSKAKGPPIKSNNANNTKIERSIKQMNDYSDYYNEWHEALKNNPQKLALLHRWGIKDEAIDFFKLGFAENWKHENSNGWGTERIIFPRSQSTYSARKTDRFFAGNGKYMLAGTQHELFNANALSDNSSRPVFVVEGEIDAILIWQLGFRVVGLGSTLNANFFVETVRKLGAPNSFVLALDNDAAGEKAQQKTGGRGQRPARHGGRPAAKERGRGGRFGEQKR